MIPRGHATVMQKDCFHDGVSNHIMYCAPLAHVAVWRTLSMTAGCVLLRW